MKQPLAVSVLFLSSVGWGLTWLPIKGLNQMGLDGMHLVLIAFASAGLMLSPFLIRQWRAWQGKVRLLLLIALFGGLANLTFQTAIYHGDVVRVMILFYLLPVWSVLGGWYFLKERVDALRITAVIMSLAGALLILQVDSSTFSGLNLIDVLAIIAGMTFAMNNILFRATAAQPLASKVGAMFLGCAAMMGAVLVFIPVQAAVSSPLALVYAALYGILFLSAITFATQWGVTQLEAGRAALIIVMELVAAVVSVALLTDVDLSLREIIGGLLVLSAAVMEGWREPAPERSAVA